MEARKTQNMKRQQYDKSLKLHINKHKLNFETTPTN